MLEKDPGGDFICCMSRSVCVCVCVCVHARTCVCIKGRKGREGAVSFQAEGAACVKTRKEGVGKETKCRI